MLIIFSKKSSKRYIPFFFIIYLLRLDFWGFYGKFQNYFYVLSVHFLGALEAKNAIEEVEIQKVQSLNLNLRPKKAKLVKK